MGIGALPHRRTSARLIMSGLAWAVHTPNAQGDSNPRPEKTRKIAHTDVKRDTMHSLQIKHETCDSCNELLGVVQPVYTCRHTTTQHSFCANCAELIKQRSNKRSFVAISCPKCPPRNSSGMGFNQCSTNLFGKMPTKCRLGDCEQIVHADGLLKHEASCSHRPFYCHACKKVVPLKSYLKHYTEYHQEYAITTVKRGGDQEFVNAGVILPCPEGATTFCPFVYEISEGNCVFGRLETTVIGKVAWTIVRLFYGNCSSLKVQLSIVIRKCGSLTADIEKFQTLPVYGVHDLVLPEQRTEGFSVSLQQRQAIVDQIRTFRYQHQDVYHVPLRIRIERYDSPLLQCFLTKDMMESMRPAFERRGAQEIRDMMTPLASFLHVCKRLREENADMFRKVMVLSGLVTEAQLNALDGVNKQTDMLSRELRRYGKAYDRVREHLKPAFAVSVD